MKNKLLLSLFAIATALLMSASKGDPLCWLFYFFPILFDCNLTFINESVRNEIWFSFFKYTIHKLLLRVHT